MLVIAVALVITACGSKSANDVIGDLEDRVENLNSYKGNGVMALQTGENTQEYNVEVWYKKPNYYRIELTNAEKNISQIVLRNDEGVFVLTPHLKKSFRFQSDWPNKNGQIYLFQTLVSSVTEDEERKFATNNDDLVFDVKANYRNSMMVRQEITFTKQYEPKQVRVMDAQDKEIVTMQFQSFEFDSTFEADDFDMERNMTSWNLESQMSSIMTDETVEGMEEEEQLQQLSGVIIPAYTPEGVVQQGISDMQLGDDDAVLIHYAGDYQYTIVQSTPRDQAVHANSMQGDLVDLGYTFAVLTGDEMKMMHWYNEGVEFRLMTADLPLDEMIAIAKSVQGQIGK